jgi:hypothetical protein
MMMRDDMPTRHTAENKFNDCIISGDESSPSSEVQREIEGVATRNLKDATYPLYFVDVHS